MISAFYGAYIAYWREYTISYNQAALLGFTIILITAANAIGSY